MDENCGRKCKIGSKEMKYVGSTLFFFKRVLTYSIRTDNSSLLSNQNTN